MSRESHIKSIHAERRNATKRRARETLNAMRAEGVPITFQSVSRASGLSPGLLYYHRDLRDEIARARDEHRRLSPSRVALAGIGTAAEMHREVLELRRRVSELEDEIKLSELLLDIDCDFDICFDCDR